ncbi:MAG: Ig-like domain-containing protein [Clostridia bacterium]|nr:Ig-like domain-containing protein [Clostridia bacterium]
MKTKTSRILKRTIALIFAILTIFNSIAYLDLTIGAAECNKKSISSVSLDTIGENLYRVTKNSVPVRVGQSVRSELYCYFNKNTVFVASESTKTHYKIQMDKRTVYINKEYCSKVGDTYNASLAKAVNDCKVREAPYESAATLVSLKKDDVICIVGYNSVRNKYLIGNHWWTAVYVGDNKIGYIYTKNITKISSLSLSVTGRTRELMAGESMKMTYNVSPVANGVVWSTSNNKVAKIDISGKVTAIAGGNCKIYAKVNNIITVSYDLHVESWEDYLKKINSKSKEVANRKSFNGYCGLFVGAQVKAAGITSKIVDENGNNQYDYYTNYAQKHNGKTDAGYIINSYPADQYNLKNALNKLTNNGKKSICNILVGFHTGSGEDGRRYGHAVMIHHFSSEDGKIYFSESFSAKVAGKTYSEGTPIVCTIDQFVQYYSSWCTYEGIIHFYK